ncbi:hypothetical protein LOZ53_000705 [Ophidiomyces ophidiicola]|nr:hypothetical protein LOZ53_000705 [Ophidiomyces ophidiicola]
MKFWRPKTTELQTACGATDETASSCCRALVEVRWMSSFHRLARCRWVTPFISYSTLPYNFCCWRPQRSQIPKCRHSSDSLYPLRRQRNGSGSFKPNTRNIRDLEITRQRDEEKIAGFCRRETPSDALIASIRDRNFQIELSKPKFYSVDLSWFNPNKLVDTLPTPGLQTRQKKSHPKHPARLSYATIVADYIRYVEPVLSAEAFALNDGTLNIRPLDASLFAVFDDLSLDYLSQRGYSADDVMVWAWILLAPDSYTAAMRLTAVNSSNVGKLGGKRAPLFVLLFILRRKAIGSKALKLLLVQSWDIMLHPQLKTLPQTKTPKQSVSLCDQPAWFRSGDDTSVMILFVRLIRAARIVSPEALFSIAQMFTAVFGYDAVASTLKDKQVGRLITYYNKILSLLALPCRVVPYISTVIQQRAIFHLLREMTKFEPPLAVTREGYHAVTRIQNARRKLNPDKQWAKFKAKSWPPWKEDKLGIDVDKGLEGSRSKTIGAITRMKEAGYSATRWDRIATILAGWDLDGTPTIQTRSFLPGSSPYHMRSQHTAWLKANSAEDGDKSTVSGLTDEDSYSDIWAARIRATRTMKEAWACFLSCKDQGFPITKGIYLELAEKVIFYEYLQNSSQATQLEALPGDGKEVYPEPTSPRDVIYVHSDPPTLEMLIQQLFSENVTLSRKLLVLLLTHSTSFISGLDLITRSELSTEQAQALTSDSWTQDSNRKRHLDSISDDIFAAFIRFLCRFSCYRGKVPKPAQFSLSQFFPIIKPPHDGYEGSGERIAADKSLAHAVFLLRLRMPDYLPSWNHLLTRLARTRLPATNPYFSSSEQRVMTWNETCEALSWMETKGLSLDTSCFHTVCDAFSRLLLAIRKDIHGVESGIELLKRAGLPGTAPAMNLSSSSEMVSDSIGFLKRTFDDIVLPSDGPLFPSVAKSSTALYPSNHPALPKMFMVPNPSTIHAFVRVLGLAADFESVLSLLKWMSQNSAELRRVAKELLGGDRAMRLVVIAVRVYIEKHIFDSDYERPPIDQHLNEDVQAQSAGAVSEASAPPQSYLQEARDIIENSELFSPWATDTEVRQYVADHEGF